MRLDHLHHHLSRRQMLGALAATGAAAAVGATSFAPAAHAGADGTDGDDERGRGTKPDPTRYDDLIDIDAGLAGKWAEATRARYGADDQRGTMNEITAAKTTKALRILDRCDKVVTHNLGQLLVNGVPGYVTFPPRKHDMRITALGYEPGDPAKWFSTTTRGIPGEDEWRAADRARGPLGYQQGLAPFGANQLSGHEERFPEGGTYQLATQLDGLAHIGLRDIFYNGFKASEFAKPTGVEKLGIEHVGPIVTRGVLIDVLGWKQSKGGSDVQMVGGKPMLTDTYRITVDDLVATMKWEGVRRIERGDVVLIRTGWNQLANDPDTYTKYLTTEPGIYVREAKFLGDHHPAIIGADSWALEVVAPTDPNGYAFGVHTELIPKRGIRIGEGIVLDSLAEEGSHVFVYCYSPNYAKGATAGNTAPFALTTGGRRK
jgi:kynurenine formamidase